MSDVFDNFTKRLINDLQSSWQKTAILVVLFCVGLCLWIPPLIRTLTEDKKTDHAVAVTAQPDQQSPSNDVAQKNVPFNWQRIETILEQDKLVQPVTQNTFSTAATDPFEIDWSQFSPPVLFAEETEPKQTPASQVAVANPSLDLNLKSTIIGRQRRAALINSKLYREGSTFQIQQRTLHLKSVQHRHVILSDGDSEFVLQLETKLDPANMAISGAPNTKSSLNKDSKTEIK